MQYVRYVGAAHRRVIDPVAWKSVGIAEGPGVVWEAQNGFAVPLDQFTDQQIKRAIDPDPQLVITEEGDDFEPTPRPYDMTPRELDQAVNNPVDVLALLNGTSEPVTAISGPSKGLAAPNGNVRHDEVSAPTVTEGNIAKADKAS